MSQFSYSGHNYEVKTTRGGEGPITAEVVKEFTRKAKKVIGRYRSITLLCPINAIERDGDADRALRRFRQSQRVPIFWHGPEGCDNVLRATGKTDKHLYSLIKKAITDSARRAKG